MQLSAEVRWFWPENQATWLEEWFVPGGDHNGIKAGGGSTRVDVYLLDAEQDELGLKRRGKNPGVEVKGLVEVFRDGLDQGPFRGPIQIWCKWTSEPLVLANEATVSLEKTRWLRKFAGDAGGLEEIALGGDEMPLAGRQRPNRGCNVEVTRVSVLRPEGGVWWSLGLESFGTLETVREDLIRTAELLARRNHPELVSGVQASYPEWLRTCLATHSASPLRGRQGL